MVHLLYMDGNIVPCPTEYLGPRRPLARYDPPNSLTDNPLPSPPKQGTIRRLGPRLLALDSSPAVSASRFHQPFCQWITTNSTLTDDPLVPIHLLVFGFQSFLTSWTCLCEVWAWEDRTVAEKQNLTTLYGPYVALGTDGSVPLLPRCLS